MSARRGFALCRNPFEASAAERRNLNIPRLEKCEVCEGKARKSEPTEQHHCQERSYALSAKDFFGVMLLVELGKCKSQNPCKNCSGAGKKRRKTLKSKFRGLQPLAVRVKRCRSGRQTAAGRRFILRHHVAEHENSSDRRESLFAVPVTFAQAALGAK